MPVFTKDERRILFIHVPKAAGSSIEKQFTSSGWKMDYYNVCATPYEPALQHLTYDELSKTIEGIDDLESFCVVRNPFKRMISEWRWQVNIMRNTDLDFPNFVRRVQVSLKTSKTYWDNHWRPQTDFITEQVDDVFKMEELNRCFQRFAREKDLGFTTLPTANKSKKRFAAYPKLTINDEAVDRIRDIYRDDFELLEYSKEMPAAS